MVLFAQGDDERAGGGLLGLNSGSGAGGEEKGGLGIVTEVIAEDAEGAWGVTEGAGNLLGGAALEEIGAEGFVLALFGQGGLAEEAAGVR